MLAGRRFILVCYYKIIEVKVSHISIFSTLNIRWNTLCQWKNITELDLFKSTSLCRSHPLCVSRIWPREIGSLPAGRRDCQPVGIPLANYTTCAKSALSEKTRVTNRRTSSIYSVFKLWSQLTTDGYIVVVHQWVLKSTRRSDKTLITLLTR